MENNILGNVHSIETFGTVDGPGIRMVIFMQGCPMRCKYCHNPDTWNTSNNKLMSVDDILNKYNGVKEFLRNGGITVSGGEPLLQIDFITELFKAAKLKNIHTALDTSGILFDINNTQKYDELIKYSDLILLDIKHINDEEHKKLTLHSNKSVLNFAKYLSDNNVPVWIRHVVVKSITFNEEYLKELGKFISNLKNVKAIEVLPYHDMAKEKYKNLNIDYSLENEPNLTKEEALYAKKIILKAFNNENSVSNVESE